MQKSEILRQDMETMQIGLQNQTRKEGNKYLGRSRD